MLRKYWLGSDGKDAKTMSENGTYPAPSQDEIKRNKLELHQNDPKNWASGHLGKLGEV
jgi:hypothetical protein